MMDAWWKSRAADWSSTSGKRLCVVILVMVLVLVRLLLPLVLPLSVADCPKVRHPRCRASKIWDDFYAAHLPPAANARQDP